MFDFLKRKKKAAAAGAQKPLPSSSLKQSLLSLEQRLMFDAAAAATAAEVKSEQVAQEQAEAAVSTEASPETTGAENVESQDVLNALASYMPTESRTEVAFVDPTVPNYQELLAGMDPNTEVIMLDAGKDGVQQIADSLAGRTGVDAIHLISHGSSGALHLGTGTLTTESMSGEYAGELAAIRAALSERADLLVYGCDFAEGQTGLDAVQRLADLTGADIQASTDVTGHISLGGDWEFEVQTGAIETNLVVTDSVQMNWVGLLGTETVRDNFSTESYSNNNGTQSWSSNWSETDADGGGAGGGDVRVNSSQLRIDADSVGNQVSRQVNLSGTSGATLSFEYNNTLSGSDRIEMRVSADGGTSYTTLAAGVFSTAANTGSGTATFDISAYASANTRIQFMVTGSGGSDRLYVDNVQVSYNTGAANSAPAISSNGGGPTASVAAGENGTVVTTVTATDADAGHTLGYSIVGGADAAKFTINSSTGQFGFASAPNYEAPTDSGGNNVYDVTVQVSDGQGGTDTQAIAVTVADANEAPTDLALSANTVAENAANGTVVGTVSGTDPDAGDTKTYSLTDTAGGRFAINSSTGQITVADGSLLNYEAATSHSVTVRVMDSGGQSYDETFTINLTNVNEAPTITSNGGGATVSLSVAENQTTVTTVAAVDVDTGTTLAYSLAGGPDAARFSIDGTTGALRFSAAPNFERASDVGRNNVYDVTVQVSDGQGGTTTQAISVRVTDVNEAPTIGSNGGRDTASITIRENGTTVTTVRSTDPDGGARITYSVVGGADAALFTINPSTGVLRFSSATNFEQPTDTDRNNVYQVVVQASDGRGGTDSQVISVRVTNVNEAPTDLSLSANTVAENAANGTVVGTVTGTDPDAGDTKTYSCTDSAGGRFAINRSTGVITVANGALLNYEAASSHNVTVRVTDRGGLTYNETFTIHLTDVNEAVPTITSNGGGATASVTISENTTAVTTVTATDADTRQTLTYSISGGADAANFTINSATGALSFVSAPNYESPTDSGGNNVYDVTVQVSDGNRRTDTQAIAVTVTNVNETPTDLSLSGNTVAEQAATGTVVGTITGTDPDAGDTKSYSLTDTAGGRFAVNSSTGAITVADGSLLNYESATSHSVTVRVTDSGGLTYDETFTINLTNVNEAPTALALSANTVAENAANGTVVGTASTTDPDAGDTHTYQLTDTAGGRFAINASTGVITVADGSLLNYEAATSHSITVRTTDAGGLTHDQVLAITVTDVHDGLVPGPLLPGTPPPIAGTPVPLASSGPAGPGPADGPASTPAPSLPDAARSVSPAAAPRVMPALASMAGPGHVREGEKPVVLEDDREPIAWTVVEPALNLLHEAADQLRTLAQSPEIPVTLSELIVKELDAMTASLEDAMQGRQDEDTLVAATAAGVSVVLSAGYLVWVVRGGWLVASLMATMPAWRSFDPLPVLVRAKEDREREGPRNDRRAPRREDQQIEHLFGSEGGRAA
jgi:hypothetical protein